jgi:hypothetical protein
MPAYFDIQLLSPSPTYRQARQALRYIPHQFVSQTERRLGAGPATVLHLSTVSNNRSSNRCVAGILNGFHAIAPFQVVMADGLAGEADLSALRALPRREIDRHFEEGRLMPQPYFAATADGSLRLHGLEDVGSFQDCVQSSQAVLQSQPVVADYLKRLEAGLKSLAVPADSSRPLPLAQPRQWLKQLADLLKLQLVYEQWAKTKPLLERFGPGGFEVALAGIAPPGSAPLPEVPGSVCEAAAQAMRFYRAAVKRGEAFANNALALLSTAGITWATSSFTGFQATVYLEALREAGVSYLHLTPKLDLDELGEKSVNLFEVRYEELFAPPKNSA